MEVDATTKASEYVEYARIKVRTTISFKVDISEDIMINDRLCQVSVVEENPVVDGDLHRGLY